MSRRWAGSGSSAQPARLLDGLVFARMPARGESGCKGSAELGASVAARYDVFSSERLWPTAWQVRAGRPFGVGAADAKPCTQSGSL